MKTSDETKARAIHAKQLLDDPLFVEAFDTIRQECLAQWEETPVRDSEGRERIWMMVKLLERIKSHFKTAIDDGKIVNAEIASIERAKLMQRVTNRFNA